jgi:hypothetical protein
MAVLEALLSVPEAQALLDALGRYADALDDTGAGGPPRSRAQKMADCLLDLVLRPGETELPAVQARLTLVAPVATLLGGDQPAEIGDTPVPAELARALAQGLGLLPTPADTDPAGAPCDAPEPAEIVEAGQLGSEDWWAEVEAQILADPGDELPPEELARQLEATAAALRDDPNFAAWFHDADPVPLPREAGLRGADEDTRLAADPLTGEVVLAAGEPSWWAAADAAVAQAGAAQLELSRALARADEAVVMAEMADRFDREDWEQTPAARISAAPDALAALAHAGTAQRAAMGALLERTGGGGLADRPRIAVTDALTGGLLALTDAAELRAYGSCGRLECRTGRTVCDHDLGDRPGLGPPEGCDTYRPGARLDRYARARDRRCRFPGCRRRVPAGGELDHTVPWPDGATSADNLTGFCTGHHRGKHQAPGWSFDRTSDGTLTVTTPTGLIASTDPPPF